MLYERWSALPGWLRYASLAAFSGAAALLTTLILIQPRQTAIDGAARDNQQTQARVSVLRHNLIASLASTKEAGRRIDALPDERFSAAELVRYAGGKLEKWQPESKPAVLEMLLTWEKLPAMFARLSGYRAMRLQGFSVEPADERLKLTLLLEMADEP